MLDSEHALQEHIDRRRWKRAQRELLRLIDTGGLDVSQYTVWGQYACQIDQAFGRDWERREAFWKALRQSIAEAETRRNVRTHKGLIYFRIGTIGLFSGRTFRTVMIWLRRAYEEDRRFYRDPKRKSAYRMLVIVKAFDRFCRKIRNPNMRPVVSKVISTHRARIGRLIGAVYDKTLMGPPVLRGLNWGPFDRLLGRNQYRALVEQSYRGAEWLCDHRIEIERTNLEKYGIAQAILVLCGTTIEGVLLDKPAVRRRVRLRGGGGNKYTLGALVGAYLGTLSGSAELTAGLIFLWFARDSIHPEVGKRSMDDVIDMT